MKIVTVAVSLTVLLLTISSRAPAQTALAEADVRIIHCDLLRTSSTVYAGRCFRHNTTNTLLVLRPPASGLNGRWHGTGAGASGPRGDSTKDVINWATFSPAFVDVGRSDGLFSACWCVVTRATLDTEGLHFDADPRRKGPPTMQDLEVLRLARSYFIDTSRWNRHDDRNRAISYCPRNPRSRTLFCALYDASVAVRGEFYLQTHGNEAVRHAIGAASTREYQHPLTDFNNDPLIDLSGMRRMFDDAIRRTREAMVKQGGGRGRTPRQ